jgi:hypothetical protein
MFASFSAGFFWCYLQLKSIKQLMKVDGLWLNEWLVVFTEATNN